MDEPLVVASARGRWVLLATVLGSALAGIDATVVGLALPRVGKDFDVGLDALQWVVTAYTLTLAGLLLFAGSLGDRYGRRRVFVVGVVWFTVASVLCGLAPGAPALIAARALQGVGGALLTPGSLAILQASFGPDDRGRAIGAWSGLGGVATAIGPFLGGWLVSAASWRWIFLVNVPLAVVVVVAALRHVPESRARDVTGPLDVVGGALVSVALLGISWGLIEGPSRGWHSSQVRLALAGGAVALVLFVLQERRVPNPVLPLAVFSARQFTATNAVTFVVYGGLGGAFFLLPLELQQVVGFSPVAAGTAFLPITAIMLLLSARSGALAGRIGPRLQMSAGPFVIALGLAMLARLGQHSTYVADVLPAVVVFGFGLAVIVAPLTSAALTSAPGDHAGLASAINNDVARTAGLLAVAVLPAVAGLTGSSYLDPVAFGHGFRTGMHVTALACVVGGVLAALTVRNPAPDHPPEPAPRTCCAVDGPALAPASEPS